MAYAMPFVFPVRDMPIKNIFTKPKLRPPRERPEWVAANILKGAWGQFAPIITSKVFLQSRFWEFQFFSKISSVEKLTEIQIEL